MVHHDAHEHDIKPHALQCPFCAIARHRRCKANVRYGSKADACTATSDVGYGPKAGISEQAPTLSYLFFVGRAASPSTLRQCCHHWALSSAYFVAFTGRFIHGNEVSPGNLCREPAAVA